MKNTAGLMFGNIQNINILEYIDIEILQYYRQPKTAIKTKYKTLIRTPPVMVKT